MLCSSYKLYLLLRELFLVLFFVSFFGLISDFIFIVDFEIEGNLNVFLFFIILFERRNEAQIFLSSFVSEAFLFIFSLNSIKVPDLFVLVILQQLL